MSDALWRDQGIEAAVFGAMFLRGADNEVMEVIASLSDSAFNFHQYRHVYRAVAAQARVLHPHPRQRSSTCFIDPPPDSCYLKNTEHGRYI